jgi:hypothetical protein
MKKIIEITCPVILALSFMPAQASEVTLGDTSGKIITAAEIAEKCRTLESEAKLLRARLMEPGTVGDAALQKWQQMAQNKDCPNRASPDCSGCPLGPCFKGCASK